MCIVRPRLKRGEADACCLFTRLVTDARVAELVDALVLGTSIYDVGVRVPPLVP